MPCILDWVRISDESRCQLASIRLGRNSSRGEPSHKVAGAKKVLLRICVVIPFLVTGNGIEGEAAQSKLSVNVCDRGRPSPQARPIPVAGAKKDLNRKKFGLGLFAFAT